MMINESMMSGTPVAAFRMGVALDLVRHRATGYLVELGNAQLLAEALYEFILLTSDERAIISENCRTLAMIRPA